MLTQWPLAHRDSSRHSFTSGGAERRLTRIIGRLDSQRLEDKPGGRLQLSQLTAALQQVAVVVEALLAVALVTWQRVLAVTPLADFLGEQRALVDVCTPGRNHALILTAVCVFAHVCV